MTVCFPFSRKRNNTREHPTDISPNRQASLLLSFGLFAQPKRFETKKSEFACEKFAYFVSQSLIARWRNASWEKNSLIARRKFAFFVSKASSPSCEMSLFGKTASSPEGNLRFSSPKPHRPATKCLFLEKQHHRPKEICVFRLQSLIAQWQEGCLEKKRKLARRKSSFFRSSTLIAQRRKV